LGGCPPYWAAWDGRLRVKKGKIGHLAFFYSAVLCPQKPIQFVEIGRNLAHFGGFGEPGRILSDKSGNTAHI